MQLTKREQDVLRLLVQGLCNKGIAKKLGISPHTVRDHVSAMLQRTSSVNRMELALRFGQPPQPPQNTLIQGQFGQPQAAAEEPLPVGVHPLHL